MERFTTWNEVGVAVFKQSYECERCGEPTWRLPDLGNGSPTDKLCEYEDLEESGRLIKLPCSIGDTVYEVSDYLNCEYDYNCPLGYANGKNDCEKGYCCDHEKKINYILRIAFDVGLLNKIGETVFLTEEEAKTKLEELEKNQ